VEIADYEREALARRLTQIDAALGHPRLSAQQRAMLSRERDELERTLVTAERDG
jgi:hypothetical protein